MISQHILSSRHAHLRISTSHLPEKLGYPCEAMQRGSSFLIQNLLDSQPFWVLEMIRMGQDPALWRERPGCFRSRFHIYNLSGPQLRLLSNQKVCRTGSLSSSYL